MKNRFKKIFSHELDVENYRRKKDESYIGFLTHIKNSKEWCLKTFTETGRLTTIDYYLERYPFAKIDDSAQAVMLYVGGAVAQHLRDGDWLVYCEGKSFVFDYIKDAEQLLFQVLTDKYL